MYVHLILRALTLTFPVASRMALTASSTLLGIFGVVLAWL